MGFPPALTRASASRWLSARMSAYMLVAVNMNNIGAAARSGQ